MYDLHKIYMHLFVYVGRNLLKYLMQGRKFPTIAAENNKAQFMFYILFFVSLAAFETIKYT